MQYPLHITRSLIMAGKHSSQFLHHQAIHIEHSITALNPKTFLGLYHVQCIIY